MSLTISLPLTQEAATACVVAADSFGVEPWEIAVHALALRQRFELARPDRSAGATENGEA